MSSDLYTMASLVDEYDAVSEPAARGYTFHMDQLAEYLPEELRRLGDDQSDIPRIAKDRKLTALIGSAVREIPSEHDVRLGDARKGAIEDPLTQRSY
jgi:hypothetical protein